MRSSFLNWLSASWISVSFLFWSCDHLLSPSCFRDVVQTTSSTGNSSVDSKPHTTFPCFIISSWQWVGLLFFIKRLCKLTEECLFCLLLVTIATFLRMDFSKGPVKIFSQFLSNSESDRSMSRIESLLAKHCCLILITESCCVQKPSPSVKFKTLLERSVLFLFAKS